MTDHQKALQHMLRDSNLATFAAMIRDGARVRLTYPTGDTRVLSIQQYIELPVPLLVGVTAELVKES